MRTRDTLSPYLRAGISPGLDKEAAVLLGIGHAILAAHGTVRLGSIDYV